MRPPVQQKHSMSQSCTLHGRGFGGSSSCRGVLNALDAITCRWFHDRFGGSVLNGKNLEITKQRKKLSLLWYFSTRKVFETIIGDGRASVTRRVSRKIATMHKAHSCLPVITAKLYAPCGTKLAASLLRELPCRLAPDARRLPLGFPAPPNLGN
jgi:hypothetical protein